MPNAVLPERVTLHPQAKPPALGVAWGMAWKLVGYAQDADFVLSVSNRNLATILQSALIGPGWWIFVIVSIVWLVVAMRQKPSSKRPSAWVFVAVTAVPAFALGAIIVAANANQAKVVSAWYTSRGSCDVVLDGTYLAHFGADYMVHLACGPIDAATDRITDSRTHFSNPRTITAGNMRIQTSLPAEKAEMFARYPTRWYQLVLIPEGLDMERLTSLREVTRNRGKLIGDPIVGGALTQ